MQLRQNKLMLTLVDYEHCRRLQLFLLNEANIKKLTTPNYIAT